MKFINREIYRIIFWLSELIKKNNNFTKKKKILIESKFKTKINKNSLMIQNE